MKERILDVIKWWLIIGFGAIAFYLCVQNMMKHQLRVLVGSTRLRGKMFRAYKVINALIVA
jgi:hypothetical protein